MTDPMIDPASLAYFQALALHSGGVVVPTGVSEAEQRRWQVEAAEPVARRHAVAGVTSHLLSLTLPGQELAVRLYRPEGADGSVLVYLHGGGWVTGSLATHDLLCRELAQRSRVTILSVGYRRAPENPHPAAQEDALAVVDWLRQVGPALGVDPQRLALGGDSAGAHLALGAALRAPGVPLAALLLLYPALDPTCSADSYATLSGVGGGLTRAAMVEYWAAYLGRDVDADTLHDPSAAPVRADDAALARLPPCCIVSAAVDPLRDEAEAFATRLTTLGVAVEAWRADGLMHGFARLVQVSPAAAAAMDRAAAWLSATLAR